MANLAVGQRFKYQFFDGRAFHTPEGLNYDDRREKIGEEISDAIAYMNSLKPQGILDSGFIQRMVQMINKALKNEQILYESLGLKYYKQINKNHLNNIDDLIEQADLISKKVTDCFINKNSDAFSFLSVLNDSDFISQVSVNAVTSFSYTKLGQGERNKGKSKATNALSKAMRSGMSHSKAFLPLKELIINDVFDMLNEGLDSNSEDFINNLSLSVDKQIDDIIYNTLKENFQKSGLLWEKNSKRNKTLRTTTKEKDVKGFYKDLYRNFEKEFSKNIEKKRKSVRKYLGGSLVIGEEMKRTHYGTQILAEIYEESDNKSGYGEMKEGLDFNTFCKIFADFLISEIKIYKGSDSGAYRFISKSSNKNKLIKVLTNAYSFNKESEEQKIRSFAQFSKSNISGLFGEIGAAFILSTGNTNAVVSGDSKNKLGQKISADIRLTIYKKEGRKVIDRDIVGIQVKNYTSSDKINLYGSTQINLDNNAIQRYISPKDLRVLRFLAVNHNIAKEKYGYNFTKKDLENFLYVNFDNFLRINDLEESEYDTIQNGFYYLNNNIYSSSYLLLLLLKDALKIIERAKNKSIFEVLGRFLDYPYIEDDKKGRFYKEINLNEQPRANKISPNSNGKMVYSRAWSFEAPDGKTYPQMTSDNLLSNMKIKFKGIIVKTDLG